MLRSTLSSWREYLTPVSHKSTFLSTGQITPEEFVQAGDYLCHMFPTWRWNDVGDDVSYRDFLPEDKQFLVIRKVPCLERAQAVLEFDNKDEVKVYDHVEEDDMEIIEVQDKGSEDWQKGKSNDVHDIDDMMEEMEIQGDEDIVETVTDLKLRYYDLFITYSTSYRVPKMYIVGFHKDGTPLTPHEMFEDITPDYRKKTATIEKLPFYKSNVPSVSIHPCKHANVMKVLLDKVSTVKERRRDEVKGVDFGVSTTNEEDGENWEDLQQDIDDSLRADQYLIVFLKFITSVTPTIQHDYTMEGW
ncbi:Autophagy-related protein 3 [Nakaseomyces bracarensis]|uniref:Autophagy-related protein 3 n=1 Tax=Nakaseomyces bracarensis TaxID=273131 RepID=A0ABR4NQP7_9SACH